MQQQDRVMPQPQDALLVLEGEGLHQNHPHVIARMDQAAAVPHFQVHVAFAQANKETKKC